MKSVLSLAAVAMMTVAVAAGCNHERSSDIPPSAQVVAEGGKKITYTAPRDGRVWVFNRFNENMEWAGRVKSGDTVVVDPDADKIFLNGMNVNNKPLTEDQKRIFFQPDDQVMTETRTPGMVERRQVMDPSTGRVIDSSTTVTPGTIEREVKTVSPR